MTASAPTARWSLAAITAVNCSDPTSPASSAAPTYSENMAHSRISSGRKSRPVAAAKPSRRSAAGERLWAGPGRRCVGAPTPGGAPRPFGSRRRCPPPRPRRRRRRRGCRRAAPSAHRRAARHGRRCGEDEPVDLVGDEDADGARLPLGTLVGVDQQGDQVGRVQAGFDSPDGRGEHRLAEIPAPAALLSELTGFLRSMSAKRLTRDLGHLSMGMYTERFPRGSARLDIRPRTRSPPEASGR